MLVQGNAKINLTLNITGKLESGYHSVDMVMQSVSLADDIYVEFLEGRGITLTVDKDDIPTDEHNTAYKAAQIFLRESGIEKAVKIDIKKHIPSQAGIAGGSTDAAAVFVALNKLSDSPFSTEQLCEMSKQVGADVPFCILGGTCKATGTGTELEKLDDMPQCNILICKPDINVSTPVAYKLCDEFGFDEERLNTANVVNGLKTGSLYTISSNLYNKFEEVLNLKPVKKIKDTMLLYGAMGAMMSGSGPTVYGIFNPSDKLPLEMCKSKLAESFDMVYTAVPTKEGCKIICE
ncbi:MULTISPECIES: 4-(cytidine 5'-diphospho)-2-C-methyl-D-erythritol kinase [unclassified Ruminococcus]|uniref:4-(cytidine 5'-diphospho)-2-C-methyl-D-erythritol kinase n=1 Tax=unclassified Ruminococcus TaxID=2608920 RepID=UPI002109A396|nr:MULTISPECIES: 4-(cytidine 5'-diphospho)-2-C-methyl-D-erythritol kinase [unclassified Ruminococcus]MCQ4022665.1 4-(cytidine 5'-diphospho)-2-C-methyl-D-erythritol kinase [Ruminococcus sp. zg-924]MCQ4114905.1 4-(cytidine 5'-diphospho)-2-C-methyl-D-erythritol kinase [Ruminococcus sp. zg-921]